MAEKQDASQATALPDWVRFPEEEWERCTPEDAGLDPTGWEQYIDRANLGIGDIWQGTRIGADGWGCVLARGGRILHIAGDPNYKQQTASLGKAFTWALVGLAVDDGRIDPDAPICRTWTGEGELSHPHKNLDAGHHKKLTWQHLLGYGKDNYEHKGGFPVTNGCYWRSGSAGWNRDTSKNAIPGWAKWTGDPFYDNYAHAEPGTVGAYSSGGFWRLSQALTSLWNRDIKEVLDVRLFSKMGIPADEWDWVPGKVVHEDKSWYPDMPGYGDFIDPPYEINGHVVRGGPGWVVMSASNLARFSLLVATGGIWKDERLISCDWIRGHGGTTSRVAGESRFYTCMGKVSTNGEPFPIPEHLFRHEPASR